LERKEGGRERIKENLNWQCGKAVLKVDLSENSGDRVHWRGDKGWNSGCVRKVLILPN